MDIVAINNDAVQSAAHAAELSLLLVTLLARCSAAIAVAIDDESPAVLVPAEALVIPWVLMASRPRPNWPAWMTLWLPMIGWTSRWNCGPH